MIPPLFRRPDRTIAALYGAIVAQARTPRFYQDYAVPDTVLGRFDMVLLHVVLLLRRLVIAALRNGLTFVARGGQELVVLSLVVVDERIERQPLNRRRRVGQAQFKAFDDSAGRILGDGLQGRAIHERDLKIGVSVVIQGRRDRQAAIEELPF